MNQPLLKLFQPLINFTRGKGYIHPGGIRYPGGILYYPRFPDHKDPDYTPSKLFRIERIKKTKGNSWKLNGILKELGINEENRVTVVKNIPEINARLWKIKHLIKVTPIVFPYGEPTPEDIKYTVLKENGQCLVTKKLEPVASQIQALESFVQDQKKMDNPTIKKDSRRKWNNAFSGGF